MNKVFLKPGREKSLKHHHLLFGDTHRSPRKKGSGVGSATADGGGATNRQSTVGVGWRPQRNAGRGIDRRVGVRSITDERRNAKFEGNLPCVWKGRSAAQGGLYFHKSPMHGKLCGEKRADPRSLYFRP